MFSDPAVLSYTAVKNKRRIGKLKKKERKLFTVYHTKSTAKHELYKCPLCQKNLFIHTHHVSCHVISCLYLVSSCLCCQSLHCYSTARQRSKSLWLHPKVTGCNSLSHCSRFAILLKTFIVSLEMLMRYSNSCRLVQFIQFGSCTVCSEALIWRKPVPGKRVTIPAESTLARVYIRKTLTPLTDH